MKKLLLCILILLIMLVNSCVAPENITIKQTENRRILLKAHEEGFDAKIDRLAEEISNSLIKRNKTVLAILDFQDLNGRTSEFGKLISEELISRIFNINKFYVVERNLLDQIMEENRLSNTKDFNRETAIEFGNLLGVEAIISGTITEFENTIRINARIISTESGLIFATGNVEIKKSRSIKRLLSKITKTNNVKENKTVRDNKTGHNIEPIEEHNISKFDSSTEMIYEWSIFRGIKKLGYNWNIKVNNDIGITIDRYHVKLWVGRSEYFRNLKIDKTYLLNSEVRFEPNKLNVYYHTENSEVKRAASIIFGFIYEVTLIGKDDLGNIIEIKNN